MNLDEKAIQSKFNTCDDTVRQYILINLLQDGMLPESLINKKENLLAKLSYPPFMAYAQQVYKIPNRGVEKLGFLNNTLRNVTLFNASDQQVSFGELFQNTTQPYLIFDFCGSWCKPCLVEMSQYKQTKNLDKSKKIRPIWLFFENDKTKWMDVVKQYDLNPNNCFVILGANSQANTKEFALLFDWQGEFPHHFVFAKEGRIVQKNAGSLSSFSEQQLGPTVKKSSPQLPGPPALPEIK